MPIYEYQCSLCGHHFDALQKTDDKPLTLCPSCKKEGLIKLVSAPSFQLKGTGWYATDFRNKQTVADKKDDKTSNANDSSKNTTETTNETSKNAVSDKKTEPKSGNQGEV